MGLRREARDAAERSTSGRALGAQDGLGERDVLDRGGCGCSTLVMRARCALAIAGMLRVGALGWSQASSAEPTIVVPRLWTDEALPDWAPPLAPLGGPPTVLGEEQYYALRVDDLRSYPVYHPKFEPPGYRESLIALGPRPLIEPEKLATRSDWIEAGRVVFESLDTPSSRTDDPRVIAHFTDARAIDEFRDAAHDVMTSDGVLLDYRRVGGGAGQPLL